MYQRDPDSAPQQNPFGESDAYTPKEAQEEDGKDGEDEGEDEGDNEKDGKDEM